MTKTTKKSAPMERYTTIAGEVLEYPRPDGELERFLARVVDAANDPRVSHGEMIELIYGTENPLLKQGMFRGRGAVTKEVFATPTYHVMLDLLDQKRVQTGALDVKKAMARFTLTVSEAAKRLDVTTSAVRQAIQAKRLSAVKKGGRYLLDPRAVATYRDHVVRRGPKPRPALEVRMGNKPGSSFRVKARELEVLEKEPLAGGGKLLVAEVPRFERAAVAISGKRMNRLFVLVPADEDNSFEFEDFSIRGRYRVLEKENDAQRASERFKNFLPDERSQNLAKHVALEDGTEVRLYVKDDVWRADFVRFGVELGTLPWDPEHGTFTSTGDIAAEMRREAADLLSA